MRLRGRLHVLGMWLVLLALSLGGSPSSPTGCACARRDRVDIGVREHDAPGAKCLDRHPAFAERVEERERMVVAQIVAREVGDPNVLHAMRMVPRHAFVPSVQRAHAYEDRPLYIGHGQTISQPYVVAFMTEALSLDPNSVVLEIGTGSGYQAAVAAEIAREVYTIEIVESLAKSSEELLASLGYDNVHVRFGDGYYCWPEKGPFDAIIGTAAARQIPPPLIEQLKPGGRMILPVGGEHGLQYLIVATRDEQGQLHRREVMPVRFVPMTGRSQEE
jgi:protein-L-isoaspartate(D-aspartate) O-methyltransferase